MSLGVFLKGLNAIHFGSATDFLFEFLPQIIVLICMFGVMDLLIILRWLTNYGEHTNEAPSIITNMITMCLTSGKPTSDADGRALIGGDWAYQTMVMQYLVLVVAICVPLMLFAKPIIVSLTSKNHDEDHNNNGPQVDQDDHFQAPSDKKILMSADEFDLRSNL